MKNLILFCLIATLASCNAFKLSSDWIKKHGTAKQVGSYTVVTVDSLYDNTAIKKQLGYGTITWDVRNATLELKYRKADSLNIEKALKAAKK